MKHIWSPRRTWVTKDGQHLRIRDMETSHIKNCLRLLERVESATQTEMYCFASALHGEQAQYAMDQEIASVEDGEVYANPKVGEFIETFKYELLRREAHEQDGHGLD